MIWRRRVFAAGMVVALIGMAWKGVFLLFRLLGHSEVIPLVPAIMVATGVAMMGFTTYNRLFRAVILGMFLPLSVISVVISLTTGAGLFM